MLNDYTPDEKVRLELLLYNNPDGLHPVEENWRNLCRKLADDVRKLELALAAHHANVPANGSCFVCELPKLPRNWPTKFVNPD